LNFRRAGASRRICIMPRHALLRLTKVKRRAARGVAATTHDPWL
jgi:hypothetical protein